MTKVKDFLRKLVRVKNRIRAKREKSKTMKGVSVVSFPRSGRSWFRLMLNRVGVALFYSHDKSAHKLQKPYDELERDKIQYKDHKVIFIARDPRDVVVSGYFWESKRKKRFEGDISDFVKDERHGIKKVIEFYKIWDDNRNIPKDFLLVKYEDMHRDAFGVLKKVLDFLDIDSVSDDKLQEAIEFCRLSNLKKIEKGGGTQGMNARTKEIIGASKKVKDEEGLKTRKGKIGGYVDYLSDEDIEYCNKAIHDMECPWYS